MELKFKTEAKIIFKGMNYLDQNNSLRDNQLNQRESAEGMIHHSIKIKTQIIENIQMSGQEIILRKTSNTADNGGENVSAKRRKTENQHLEHETTNRTISKPNDDKINTGNEQTPNIDLVGRMHSINVGKFHIKNNANLPNSYDFKTNFDYWWQYFRKCFENYPEYTPNDFEPISNYNKIDGGFGSVYIYAEKGTGIKVAIKKIVKDKNGLSKFFRSLNTTLHEIFIMTLLNELQIPYISNLRYVMKDSSLNLYLVSNFIDGKDLTDLINERQRKGFIGFDSNFAAHVIAKVSLALSFLHKYNIVYKDLKFENIVINYTLIENSNMIQYIFHDARLIDFGLSEILLPENNYKCTTYNGTPTTLAPEVYKDNHSHGTKSDIWSLGVVMYMILVGDESPFDYDNSRSKKTLKSNSEDVQKIKENVLNMEINYSIDKFTEEEIDLLKKMIEKDEEKRLTIEEVMKHSWFKTHGISFEELLKTETERMQKERTKMITEVADNSNITITEETARLLHDNCSMVNT